MSLTAEQTMTLEAYADTIIPGEKRGPDDRAIAGVAPGGGAVAAGALDILQTDAGGLAGFLGDLVEVLNKHVDEYAQAHGIELDPSVPPFVALSYEHRVGMVATLCRPGHPEKQMWVNLAMFSNMAFDTGAHLSTAEAFATSHPGLRHLGFRRPDPDGLWRFPEYSYRRELAPIHPATTPSGSPA